MKTARESYTCAKILNSRSEAMEYIIKYFAWLDRNWKESVNSVQSDTAKEFPVLRMELTEVRIEISTTTTH